MLNEQSNRDFNYEPPEQPRFQSDQSQDPFRRIAPVVPEDVQRVIEQVFAIERLQRPTDEAEQRLVAQYVGQLTVSGEEAFEQVDAVLEKHDLFAQFSKLDNENKHLITIVRERPNPKPRPWWPNALLFVLTVASLLFIGASIQAGIDDRTTLRIWEGIPYAASLMLILGAHELGHYFAARHHGVNVTLPYFIPMPFVLFGTLGAFIQIRDNITNRKALFDIGVAGPLAGLVFTIPILFIGLATSNVEIIPTDETTLREGNSIFYATAKYLVFGEFLPNNGEDVFINQLAQAGWTGLFVTALNLVPVGQLDGGHVVYTLFGRYARRLYWPVIAVLAVLAVFNQSWILWLLLLLAFGRLYAQPLEDITPLDPTRRAIGIAVLVIFVLIFIPNPITIVPADG